MGANTQANKAKVEKLAADGAKQIGPFPGTVTPARPGFYRRVGPMKGSLVWSNWNGNCWSMHGTNLQRAIQRKNRRSKYQAQPWYGLDRDVTASTKNPIVA